MDEEKKQESQSIQTPADFESVRSVYANNVWFEPSVWDLKLIFGQLQQQVGQPTLDWHTAVTIPWMQAKILCYYLSLNIAIEEIRDGKIRVNPRVLPPEPGRRPEDGTNPEAEAIFEVMSKLYAEMFGDG